MGPVAQMVGSPQYRFRRAARSATGMTGMPRLTSRRQHPITPRSFGPAGQSAMPRASHVTNARAMAHAALPLAWYCAARWPDLAPPLTQASIGFRLCANMIADNLGREHHCNTVQEVLQGKLTGAIGVVFHTVGPNRMSRCLRSSVLRLQGADRDTNAPPPVSRPPYPACVSRPDRSRSS